jgi:hypothetical protein
MTQTGERTTQQGGETVVAHQIGIFRECDEPDRKTRELHYALWPHGLVKRSDLD